MSTFIPSCVVEDFVTVHGVVYIYHSNHSANLLQSTSTSSEVVLRVSSYCPTIEKLKISRCQTLILNLPIVELI